MPDASDPASARSRGGVMLADGTFFEGTGFGAAGRGGGRSLLQHRHDRLSGDPLRSLLCRADRRLHLSPYRHRRHQQPKTSKRITPAVRGLIVRADAEHPSNYRSLAALDRWLKAHNIPAVAGIDTRALTSLIREKGMPHGVIANAGRRARSITPRC